MKYTDEQRIEKIRSIVDKLLRYVDDNKLTREDVNEDETVRWTLTTPLYNMDMTLLQASTEASYER